VTVLGPDTGNPPIESGLAFTICELNDGDNCIGTPGAVAGLTHIDDGEYRFVAPNDAGEYRLHINGTGYQQAIREFTIAAAGGVPAPRSFNVTMAAVPADDD